MPRYGQSRIYERTALLVAIAAVLLIGATALTDDAEAQVAVASEGQTTTSPETTPAEPETEPEAAPATTAAGRGVSLTLSKSSPGNLIFDTGKKARFVFALSGGGSSDVTVRAINVRSNKVARHWKLENVRGGEKHALGWDGKRNRKGFAPEGKYTFKVYPAGKRGSDPIPEARSSRGKTRVNFHRHMFPLRAKHTYGDGFGAGRSHKGQDVFATCGKKIRAARGGRVQYSGYHSAAGYYTVIDGRGTGWDYVYMHLEKRGRAKEGERLRTGAVLGRNSDTGNASGCHLHFEMWSPTGWYEGGDPRPPTKQLKKWDRYS